MSDVCTSSQRRLQDEFGTRRLADLLVEAIIMPELSPQQSEFIHGRNMFFLATVDEDGFPSCSYEEMAGLLRRHSALDRSSSVAFQPAPAVSARLYWPRHKGRAA